MLSTRTAHTLLASATTHDGQLALARALGFSGAPYVFTHRGLRAVQRATDLPSLQLTRVTRGDHAALLIVRHTDARDWRNALRQLATYLDRLADPRRWLILLHDAQSNTLAVATWLSATAGPRLAVLTTSPTHTLDSDAQTVAAVAAAWHTDPSLTCLRWHELLGRHAIGRRFFRALDSHVTDLASGWHDRVRPEDRRTLALIHVARLLFLKFLEAKGWLDSDRAFLARQCEATLATGGHLWQRLLAPLTFGTLNTPLRQRAPAARAFGAIPFLNGGLFACSPTERRARRPPPRDDLLAPLMLGTLARYRFTAREDSSSWSEAAIDPDLLGRTFEALMDEQQRRGSGTFYTPTALVTTLVDDALRRTLVTEPDVISAALRGETISTQDATRVLATIDHLRVLDPACGSGGLLVATLERLASLRTQLGDPRPIATLRREILTRSIFGVDIAPMAVWLCELRLWLSIVIDDDTTHALALLPLPNLDHHIRVGDALGNDAFETTPAPSARRIAQLREQYAGSSGARKRIAAQRIEHAERGQALRITQARVDALVHERTELLRLARSHTLFGTRNGLTASQRRQLRTLRDLLRQTRRRQRQLEDGGAVDFDFRTHFADAAAQAGFDLVIGNPPWVRPHHLDVNTRAQLRTRFAAVSRHSVDGSRFGVQTDIAIPFTQRSLELTRPGGTLALLLPAKLWRSVAGGALRHHLLDHATPRLLRDHTGAPSGFTAAVYPSSIVLTRQHTRASHSGVHAMPDAGIECHATDSTGTPHTFTMDPRALTATDQRGAPWRIIPETVRAAADHLASAGHRWADSILPPPSLGIKTGYNDAFLLSDDEVPDALRPWTRPVLRGDHLRAWSTPTGTQAIVVPNDTTGAPLTHLPKALARHFTSHERALVARTDLRPRDPWWSLFRTDLLHSAGWRVVWADIGRTLRATILPPHCAAVPLNSCYGIRLHDPVDAHALAALLNAPSTSAWLSLVAEPARGGYHRFLGWTVLSLPLPNWQRARELLAPIAARARRGEPTSTEALHHATLDAYGVASASTLPLLAWAGAELQETRSGECRTS